MIGRDASVGGLLHAMIRVDHGLGEQGRRTLMVVLGRSTAVQSSVVPWSSTRVSACRSLEPVRLGLPDDRDGPLRAGRRTAPRVQRVRCGYRQQVDRDLTVLVERVDLGGRAVTLAASPAQAGVGPHPNAVGLVVHVNVTVETTGSNGLCGHGDLRAISSPIVRDYRTSPAGMHDVRAPRWSRSAAGSFVSFRRMSSEPARDDG